MRLLIVMLLTLSLPAFANLRPSNIKFTFKNAVVSLDLNFYSCSGVLIHPRLVLTTAHCFVRPNLPKEKRRPMRAYFTPEDFRLMPYHEKQKISRRVVEVLLAPSFGFTGSRFDISGAWGDLAMVLLDSDAPIGYPVFPIAEELDSFEHYVSLGFGVRLNESEKMDLKLPRPFKGAEIKLVSTSKPNQETIFFAQPKIKVCPGDSGGPVLARKNGAWYVLGLTSMYAFSDPKNLGGSLLGNILFGAQEDHVDCGRTIYVQSTATHRDEIQTMANELLSRSGLQ